MPNEITLSAEQLADVALSTIRAVVGEARYQYLSGPITGGKKFISWYRETGQRISDADEYRRARREQVIKTNIAAVIAAANRERSVGRFTIEPGSFEDFAQWKQQHFYDFWEKVIHRHVSSVRFMDGWAYSAGCTFEYLCAKRSGVDTFDMEGKLLGRDRALLIINSALEDIWTQLNPDNPRNAPLVELYDNIWRHREGIREFAMQRSGTSPAVETESSACII